MWWALLIPLIMTLGAFIVFRRYYIVQELLVPVIASIVFIGVSYLTIREVSLNDVEYNGYLVLEARYYEPYETWVKKTCSYTTCTGSGKSRNCTTHYYDCSYCDYIGPRYTVIDNGGHEIEISYTKYNQLIKKWQSIPKFQELNRTIKYHNSLFGRDCGKDGDMYSIYWNNYPETSESTVFTHSFKNKVKRSHSAFSFPYISDEQADTLGLYKYPDIYDVYKQKCVLGIDGLTIPNKHIIHTKMEYVNGALGMKNKVKTFTLVFKNKPIDIAFKQEAYWDGGNQNEIVTCIGIDDSLNIEWVKVFSWCDNKRITVDIREDIAEGKKLNFDIIYNSYRDNIPKYFHYKSFKDFNYLTFEPTTRQYLFVYIGTFIVSLLCIIWCIKNDLKE